MDAVDGLTRGSDVSASAGHGRDSESLPDVLVVGAGLSGGVAALRLAQAGFRVVCLEQGERTDPTAYPGGKPEHEIAVRTIWNADPNVRRSLADYPVDDRGSDLRLRLFNAVGGSTILYGAFWLRFHPSDFKTRTLDGVGDDWPLTWRDLWPYYNEVDRDFGLSGLAGDPAYPARPEPPLPPLPIGRAGELVARGMDSLGWHWWPGMNAIASRPYDGRRPCVQRGTCTSGCGEGAKGSTDRTHWPKAEALGARLITGARVRRLTMAVSGRVTGAIYTDRVGSERHQPAGVVLLAAGAVGTPRLLLLSRSPEHPDGLANSSGLVGKRLMLHAIASVQGEFDERFQSWQGHHGLLIQSHQFYETDADRGFVRGATWGLTPGPTPVEVAVSRAAPAGQWGSAVHDRVERVVGRATTWKIVGEDAPDEGNAIRLSTELKDSDGIPAPQVVYRVSANTRRLMAFHVHRASESLRAAGALHVSSDPSALDGGSHIMGTARMGDDARNAVVDVWGRCHDVPNLFVVDSSVFVTSAGANPAATIAALSLRTAAHLIEERRNVAAGS